MGKRNFRGGKGGGGKRQRGGKGGTGWDARAQWPEVVKESPALEFFYKVLRSPGAPAVRRGCCGAEAAPASRRKINFGLSPLNPY